MNMPVPSYALYENALDNLGLDLIRRGWGYAKGADMKASFGLDEQSWQGFAAFWQRLSLDGHMADGGTYRHRRYSAFELNYQRSSLLRMPHGPYEQASNINKLNGGIARHFPPLEEAMVSHPFFLDLLFSMARIFDCAAGGSGTWDVRLHPYRICSNELEQGKPTPEGLHRDGVDYIVMMLIGRSGVTGGVTRVTDALGNTLFETTLAEPLDIIVGDDHQIMHEVSPLHCAQAGVQGHRDALVIAFTRLPAHRKPHHEPD